MSEEQILKENEMLKDLIVNGVNYLAKGLEEIEKRVKDEESSKAVSEETLKKYDDELKMLKNKIKEMEEDKKKEVPLHEKALNAAENVVAGVDQVMAPPTALAAEVPAPTPVAPVPAPAQPEPEPEKPLKVKKKRKLPFGF